jgi:hypothetical protein
VVQLEHASPAPQCNRERNPLLPSNFKQDGRLVIDKDTGLEFLLRSTKELDTVVFEVTDPGHREDGSLELTGQIMYRAVDGALEMHETPGAVVVGFHVTGYGNAMARFLARQNRSSSEFHWYLLAPFKAIGGEYLGMNAEQVTIQFG